ncbi:hypothetical protein AVEN_5253-1 [Araneus ventricosus]|uniref:DDE-1 domain-containing protein n=1 Tax=Araneus ventricosus TaxID=182803 RepID=A0A4Y2MLG5_ARAVE|nr:hypothetical protein AVEN_5253-1 [Araneus ventricosus]
MENMEENNTGAPEKRKKCEDPVLLPTKEDYSFHDDRYTHFLRRKRILKEMTSAIEKNETVQENIDVRKAIAELYKVWKFDATAKTIRNCFKKGGFSNQTDDNNSDDEDAILADLKENGKQ